MLRSEYHVRKTTRGSVPCSNERTTVFGMSASAPPSDLYVPPASSAFFFCSFEPNHGHAHSFCVGSCARVAPMLTAHVIVQ